MKVLLVLLFILPLVYCASQEERFLDEHSQGSRNGNVTVCGSNGCRRTFKYVIVNNFVNPFFLETVNLKIKWNQKLIKYMETAVLEKPDQFKNFSATFTSPYGYFIDHINGVRGNWKVDGTFWIILNSTGPIPVGVSSYIPIAGETITFNFTNKWPSSDNTHT